MALSVDKPQRLTFFHRSYCIPSPILFSDTFSQKIQILSNWLLCVLFPILHLTQIVAFYHVIAHYPRSLFFIFFSLLASCVSISNVVIPAFHLLERFQEDLVHLTYACDIVMLPFTGYYFFNFLSYSLHSANYIITFYPPVTVCLQF